MKRFLRETFGPVARGTLCRMCGRSSTAETSYRAILDAVSEAVFVQDRKGRFVDVNRTAERLYGYPRNVLVGRTPHFLSAPGRNDFDAIAARFGAALGGAEQVFEFWGVDAGGREFPKEVRLAPATYRGSRAVIAVTHDITERKEKLAALERIAYYDGLTGLPNRVLLGDRLHHGISVCERHGSMLAVGYMDLDGFTPVNRRCGEAAGDRLLVAIANRLQANLRAGDSAGRLGGDEFVLLLNNVHDAHELDVLLQRLLGAVCAPVRLGEQTVRISASIGVALFPGDTAEPDALLRHADQAMYEAKRAGGNRYHLFDPNREQALRERKDQQLRIAAAVTSGEMCLHYQPKVCLDGGRVAGVEALIRWQHPERGLLPPGDFLPLAENTDLIIGIGEWAIAEALRQAQAWATRGIALSVAVNVSPYHLQQPDFVARLSAMLRTGPGLPPRTLELEIIESAELSDIDAVARTMVACKALGVGFALDDFGTGYSSLLYLKALPADTVKVDRTFVAAMLAEPEALSIVEGVIGLAAAFGREIVAEGVESEEQARQLLRLGCGCAQGFGIARPMPGEQVVEWIRDWENKRPSLRTPGAPCAVLAMPCGSSPEKQATNIPTNVAQP